MFNIMPLCLVMVLCALSCTSIDTMYVIRDNDGSLITFPEEADKQKTPKAPLLSINKHSNTDNRAYTTNDVKGNQTNANTFDTNVGLVANKGNTAKLK